MITVQLGNGSNSTAIKDGQSIDTSTKTSQVKVLVVPTNEELEIARQCLALLGG